MSHTLHFKFRAGKALQVILILLACVAVIAVAYFLPQLGPKYGRTKERVFTGEEEAALIEKRNSGLKSWQAFNNIREFRKKLEPDDVKLLKEALDNYEEYVKETGRTGAYDPELDKMRSQLQAIQAEEFHAQSLKIEALALIEADKKNYKEAENLFSRALEFEKKIGEECPLSKKKDIGRLSHLDQKIRMMQAVPLWNAVQSGEKEAQLAEKNGRRAEALEKYESALEKIIILQKNYLGFVPLEYGRAALLSNQIETLKSFDACEKVRTAAGEAAKLAGDGKAKESEEKWDAVIIAQEDLVKNYPKSEYAAPSVLEALKKRRALTLSAPLVAEFSKGLLQLDDFVRSGNADGARMQAGLLYQQAAELGKKFEGVELVSKETLKRLQYVNFKSGDMILVQNRFNKLFKPVPGESGVRMMYSEVSQVLYTVVMEEANPSASRGDSLPADSVTWEDAREFCRRLGWLLGCEVRLPNEKEFRAAVGKIDDALLPAQAWSLETAEGKAHPIATSQPNSAGFYDLLGNVSEWLDAGEEVPGAPAIGGDCQTGLDDLKNVSVAEWPKHDKSRLRGFRVVVITDQKK